VEVAAALVPRFCHQLQRYIWKPRKKTYMPTAMRSRRVWYEMVIGNQAPPCATGSRRSQGPTTMLSGRHLSSLSAQVNHRCGTTP
jgi:hypothetical protein